MMKALKFVALFSLLISTPTFASNQIAVTVDDLMLHGVSIPGVDETTILRGFIEAFQKHRLYEVYGFVNGWTLEGREQNIQVLQDWVQAGHALGNHTYSHLDLAKVSASAFIADIEKNETLLSEAFPKGNYKFLRFPFLSEGDTREKRYAVRNYLSAHHYKIASVTVDFSDWAWNDPYKRCLAKQDSAAIDYLKRSYLQSAIEQTDFALQMADQIFGRPIKHVLLLHSTEFTSLMIEPLLETYREHDFDFITMKNALTDLAYQIDTKFMAPYGSTLLGQLTEVYDMPFPPHAPVPFDTLEGLCK